MNIALGISWDDSKKRRLLATTALAVALSLLLTPVMSGLSRAAGRMVSVIVRGQPGSGTASESAVKELGGTVGRHIGIINGFVANVPEGGVDRLQNNPGVLSVSVNQRVHPL